MVEGKRKSHACEIFSKSATWMVISVRFTKLVYPLRFPTVGARRYNVPHPSRELLLLRALFCTSKILSFCGDALLASGKLFVSGCFRVCQG